jgi:hypothetical protein
MDELSCAHVNENVVRMSIAQSQYKADDGWTRNTASVRKATFEPLTGIMELLRQEMSEWDESEIVYRSSSAY